MDISCKISTSRAGETHDRTERSVRRSPQLLMQIDAARERAGLSKADLARRIGTNPSVIRRLFSSGYGNPTLQTVLDVLATVGVVAVAGAAEGRHRVDVGGVTIGQGLAVLAEEVADLVVAVRLAHRSART